MAMVTSTANLLRRRLGSQRVTVAFLELARPSFAEALDAAGGDCVVVPLLLSRGHHMEQDVHEAARGHGVTVSAHLGPHPLLAEALAQRLVETGAPAGTPAVLAAAGSSNPEASRDVAAMAALTSARIGAPVTTAAVSGIGERPREALNRLADKTSRHPALLQYLVAPGQFSDQLEDCGSDWVAKPLGSHPSLVSLIALRYRQSCWATGQGQGEKTPIGA